MTHFNHKKPGIGIYRSWQRTRHAFFQRFNDNRVNAGFGELANHLKHLDYTFKASIGERLLNLLCQLLISFSLQRLTHELKPLTQLLAVMHRNLCWHLAGLALKTAVQILRVTSRWVLAYVRAVCFESDWCAQWLRYLLLRLRLLLNLLDIDSRVFYDLWVFFFCRFPAAINKV